MRFADRDEAAFVADQLAEARDAMASDSARAARLLLALDAEAPDSGAVNELLIAAGERLARQAEAGDEQAKDMLMELVTVMAGRSRRAGS